MNIKGKNLIRLLFNSFSLLVLIAGVISPRSVLAANNPSTPSPSSVTLVGSLQSEVGCAGDWDPACAASYLTYDSADDVWQGTFDVPAGSYDFKAALNNGWDENYGLHAAPGGANIPLNLGASSTVKFYYDHKSNWITDNVNSVIAVAPGSFQSELGCPGDWQPDCLRSWLQDVDGDGIYTFSTTVIPAGNYEGKVALNETWDVSYGQGGGNIPFTVPSVGGTVTFSFDSATNVPSISVVGFGPSHDNNIEWDGLRHDSRDSLYRTPGGAVTAGTPVLIRFRTFHNDVTGVGLRVYDLNANGQRILPMSLVATDSCYQAGLEASTCDYWQASLNESTPNNLWYRFIVTDGTKTVYYADNTPALDGGLGSPSDNVVDQSFALMFYDPTFSSPAWSKGASIYQIFPDRFFNGRDNNDPKTGDIRYDDPVLKLKWGTLPEGYCRNYTDGATNCPWRFDTTPPADSPFKESPRGRDYFGGDLKGVDEGLDYLKSLGITTIYFNPIFDAGSNHGYDTQNYYKIDPYFGTQKDWDSLVKHAREKNINIVLDGVFNHLSSDSAFFDRYGHYSAIGACESLLSPYRSWFTFHDVPAGTGTCAGTAGANSATYDGWFGFDSIPVVNKSLPAVQAYFITDNHSVSNYWLDKGAAGWRLDVMGDSSFPAGYWESFRTEVKSNKPSALIISETWQKDSTLLRMLRGDRADTTMNYRLRDSVLGLLAPQSFDSKGFGDSGRIIAPSEFAARLESIREDYPDAAYYSLMNLLDSHDTERIRWTLTPGQETKADKELNTANVAEGTQRQKLASLIQFTVPGAPTVYYGDEAGLTGDDDPDDRRTMPSLEKTRKTDLFKHYQTLNKLRKTQDVLVNGDFNILLADDASQIIAYGRKTESQGAVVIVNRGNQAQAFSIPVAGYLPDGVILQRAYVVGSGGQHQVTVTNGAISGSIDPLSGLILVTGRVDLKPTSNPTNLHVTNEGSQTVSLEWNAVTGAAGYNIYRSPVSGGGYVKLNSSVLATPAFSDSGLVNSKLYYYVVTAMDDHGNESGFSNEASALPHLVIGWANLQWPPTLTHTISTISRTDNVYGQVWIDGETNQPGQTPSLLAQLGFGPSGSNPNGNSAWNWVDASFNTNAGNNDEFVASLQPESVGTFDYAYRYSTTNGASWIYADLDGIGNGYDPAQAGKLTVLSSGDTTAPTVPTGLNVLSASPAGIELAWDAIVGDASLYGYEVLRSATAGGPYALIARVTGTSYVDTAVSEGATYYYAVRSLDQSFNRSANSSEVTGTAQLRTVTLVINLTVPATTDATARNVYIAGFLDRLDGGLPQWNPGGVSLTRVDATNWTITFTGKESTAIEYKYALGAWDFVEKDGVCGEIGNRILTLSYGATGIQTVNDTTLNWRNVAPCGN
jgi:glycosidase/fibronectin type 3 domain-containing protein